MYLTFGGIMFELSKEQLIRFARLELTLSDIIPFLSSEGAFGSRAFYRMTLEDLQDALNTAVDKDMTVADFATDWFYPIVEELSGCLGLTEILPGFPNTLAMQRFRNPDMEDDEMMMWVFHKLYPVFADISNVVMNSHMKMKDLSRAEEIVEAIDIHYKNLGVEPGFREYPDIIKSDFINEWDNDLLLRGADENTRKMFVDFVGDLADHNDPDAIRILGYASYGGNSLFDCDWELAARCMDKLWREFGFGYAANSLAHIYYDGRLSDGRPDYGNAFKYFAIGSFMGVTEASCKLADMYMNGQYVAQSYENASTILEGLYARALVRFESGDRNTHLADVAYRLAMTQQKFALRYTDFALMHRSYSLLLQAASALRAEARTGGVPENSDLGQKINHNIEESKTVFPEYKSSHKTDYPDAVEDFVLMRGYCDYRATFKKLKGNRIKITIQRLKRGGEASPEKSLLPFTDYGMCRMTDSVVCTAEEPMLMGGFAKVPESVVFDTVRNGLNHLDSDLGSLEFIKDGEPVFHMAARSFIVRKPADSNM